MQLKRVEVIVLDRNTTGALISGGYIYIYIKHSPVFFQAF
ncbi:GSCOCG00003688001-RA-CDS [Cotesia congregata]|nr:GSCOCG00003688001-RA-CDS [Cotesia congregata]